MHEVETRARLVDLDAGSAGDRGPTAVLPRSEIEAAIDGGEYPARLVLEVARTAEGGGPTPEARVTVDWDQSELEELLRASGDGDVMLSFDEDELMRLLEEGDVEAHGLRERAAILGIVVATAGAASGSAFAHPQLSGDATAGATPAGAPAFITDSRGGDGGAVPAPAAASFITDSRGGDGGAVPAPAATTSFVTDSRGGDGGAVPAPDGTTSFVTDSRGGDGGLAPAPDGTASFVTDSRGGAGGLAPDGTASLVTDALGGDGGLAPDGTASLVTDSRGGTGGLTPTEVGTTSFVTDSRGGTGGVEAIPVSVDSGGISLPSPEDTAAIAGLALLITAAGFIGLRSRRDPGLPA